MEDHKNKALESSVAQQNAKKDLKAKNKMHEEIFLCFCQKQYLSFPALYLHLKQKHSIFIKKADKTFLRKEVEWSGSKKKTIYEIEEEKLENLEISQEQSRNLQPNRQLSSKDSQIKTNKFLEDLPEPLCLFLEELNSSKNRSSNKQQEILLVHTLYTFILQKETSNADNTSHEHRLSILPMHLNDFMVEKFWKGQEKYLDEEWAIKLLLQLSGWLYRKKLSPHIAVKNNSS